MSWRPLLLFRLGGGQRRFQVRWQNQRFLVLCFARKPRGRSQVHVKLNKKNTGTERCSGVPASAVEPCRRERPKPQTLATKAEGIVMFPSRRNARSKCQLHIFISLHSFMSENVECKGGYDSSNVDERQERVRA